MGSRNGTTGHEASYRYGVKFSLKMKDTKAKTGFVLATITHARKRIRFSIVPPGESPLDFNLQEEHWNKTTGRPKRAAVNFPDIDARITEVESEVKDYVNSCIRDGRPLDLEELKTRVAGGVSERHSITVLFERFIHNRKIVDRFNNERPLAKSTKKSFGTTLNNLKAFETSLVRGVERHHPVTLDHFVLPAGSKANTEPAVLRQFRKFLTDTKDYRDNSLSRELKNLAAFLKWVVQEGMTGKLRIITSIKCPPIVGTGYPLYPSEISKLYKLDTIAGSRKWHVQQLFVLAFDTSLRFSDLHQVDPIMLREKYQIVENQKTRGTSTVVHYDRVREILRKYSNIAWPKMIRPNAKGDFTQSWRFNDILKELAKEAGLDRVVPVEVKRGGKVCIIKRPLHEIISSKFGRVSFVSNAVRRGLTIPQVQMQTGHTTDKMLRKNGPYYKAMHDEFATSMGVEELHAEDIGQ